MPKLHLLCIGKPKLAYAKAGIAEYLSRLQRYGSATTHFFSEGTPESEGQQLLQASTGMFRVILDERGKTCRSKDLAQKLENWDLHAIKNVAFLIGGANGHAPHTQEKADWLFSLSTLTLQHELALLILTEQLYRAQSIRQGEPYHRD
jgi:23S rRNA (pseudouridine1915-N3)-methyltransferase